MPRPSTAALVRVGDRFNRWTVTGPAIIKNHKAHLPCRCECGTEKLVYHMNLVRDISLSCGCYRKEQTARNFTKHGDTVDGERPRVLEIWANMIQRCTNPKTRHFENYGGRGITVCAEWRDYTTFRDWALANGYRDDMQIDRIDNNGGYAPSNCRWVTARVNCNNRRISIILTAWGETKSLSEWLEDNRCAVSRSSLHRRIEAGWEHEKVLSQPPGVWKGTRR